MTYDDVISTILGSSKEDWELILCGGGSLDGGPSFLDEDQGDQVVSHSYRGVYRPDISLGLAFGLGYVQDKRQFEWAKSFANSQTWPTTLDVLWNGMLIHREHGLVVDGGRMTLPWPTPAYMSTEDRPMDAELVGESVTKAQVKFWQLVNELKTSIVSFTEYLDRSGLVAVDR
jgi:hypothetical protein